MRDAFAGVWRGRLERAVRCRVDDVEIVSLDRDTTTFAVGDHGVVVHLDGNGKTLVSTSLTAGGTITSGRFEDRARDLSLSRFDVDDTTVITVADVIADHLIGPQPRSGPKTLRDGYGPPDLTTEAGRRRERFLAMKYNGVAFAEHTIQYRNNDPSEVNYSKEMAEAISFAHLAVGAGIDHRVSDIENRQPPEPDLHVTLVDGADTWVEVGQVTESASAKYFSAIQKVNQHLRRLENADPAYLGEIQGRHVSVQLPSAPPAAQSKTAADEIVVLLRSINFDTVMRRALISLDPQLRRISLRSAATTMLGTAFRHTCVLTMAQTRSTPMTRSRTSRTLWNPRWARGTT